MILREVAEVMKPSRPVRYPGYGLLHHMEPSEVLFSSFRRFLGSRAERTDSWQVLHLSNLGLVASLLSLKPEPI